MSSTTGNIGEAGPVIVDARVNGVATRVLIDSGARYSIVDSGLIRDLEPLGTLALLGMGASEIVCPLHRIEVTAGCITIRVTAAAWRVATHWSGGWGAILGRDVLSLGVFVYDRQRWTLTFEESHT